MYKLSRVYMVDVPRNQINSLEKVGDNKRGQSANKISEGNYRLELSR